MIENFFFKFGSERKIENENKQMKRLKKSWINNKKKDKKRKSFF